MFWLDTSALEKVVGKEIQYKFDIPKDVRSEEVMDIINDDGLLSCFELAEVMDSSIRAEFSEDGGLPKICVSSGGRSETVEELVKDTEGLYKSLFSSIPLNDGMCITGCRFYAGKSGFYSSCEKSHIDQKSRYELEHSERVRAKIVRELEMRKRVFHEPIPDEEFEYDLTVNDKEVTLRFIRVK